MAGFARRQRGMGFWGLVVVLFAIAVVVLVGLKLFPIYMESFKVDQALEKIIRDDDIRNTPRTEIHAAFLRYMSIEDVDRFSRQSLRKQLDVEKKKDDVTLTLTYTARAHLFKNLSVVADWEKVVSTAP